MNCHNRYVRFAVWSFAFLAAGRATNAQFKVNALQILPHWCRWGRRCR